ncbi:peptidase [Streptomyces sp. NPDC047043]|uniref:trypsin-like serine peptidase n=1 Tax=Streptomyces sp. NPDC047043 TaxID=3154497 RepID=UPI00340DF8E2
MRLRALGPCALALVAAATLLPTRQAAETVTTVTYSKTERTQALSYWTRERMRQAGASLDEGTTPADQQPWRGPRIAPIGRLFFVDDKGEDSWCTATSVPARNRSVALTAAHCTQVPASPGNHYISLVFVPGYAKGAMLYGAYAVRAFTMPRSWERDDTYDVAALVLDPRSGRRLADVVGTQPVAFTGKPGGNVALFGYPATRPQRGEELMSCTTTARAARGNGQAAPCGMGGGASGGPWLARFDPAQGTGTVTGVTSYGNGPTDSTMTGAELLGPLARQVYDQAQGR